jgi:hypothetical protein
MHNLCRIIHTLIIIAFLFNIAGAQIYYRIEQNEETQYSLGLQDGKRAGQNVTQVGWALKGFGCAFLTCGPGGCFVWTQARHSGDVPADVPIGKDPQYILGYIEGYKLVTRSNKQTAAMIGCVIGTAIDVAIIGVLTSGYVKTFSEVWNEFWQ